MWSEWREIDQPTEYGESAVYRIRLAGRDGPALISRFLGRDQDGLMCIGKTGDMEGRRKQFVSGLNGRFGHSEGNLLHILEEISLLRATYEGYRYQYSFAKLDGGLEGKEEERQIKAYVKQFGEVPPLNSAIPDRKGNW